MKTAHPDTPKLPTTWKRHNVVHEVIVVRYMGRSIVSDKTRIEFSTACGHRDLVDDHRAFIADRPVDCLNCIAAEPQKTFVELSFTNPCGEIALTGEKADMIIIDEVQDFMAVMEPGILKKSDE